MKRLPALRALNVLLVLGICALTLQLLRLPAVGRSGGLQLPANHEFLRGDSNTDQVVDISDAVFTLQYLFLGGPEPECLAAADANDDDQLDISDAVRVLAVLFQGGSSMPEPYPLAGEDPTPIIGCREPTLDPLPAIGSPGGPDRVLSAQEEIAWRRGRDVFTRGVSVHKGLGPFFNGDSCRACHLDPAVGGAGGKDVDVLRFGHFDEEGVMTLPAGGPLASRHTIQGVEREELPLDANFLERRQTPTVFGLGLVDRIPDAAILANADPDDSDGDGISGRARMVGGRVARFGHKAGVPTLKDFAADASFNELGLTVDSKHSTFAGSSDGDVVADPELGDDEFLALVFFMEHLAQPQRHLPIQPLLLARVNEGQALFTSAGCAQCHTPELEGADGPVAAFSDFLLHDVADPSMRHFSEGEVASGTEFRTAPLWGVRDTAPYMHDGAASTLDAAILGHFGEAAASKAAFQALSLDDRAKVVEFLQSL